MKKITIHTDGGCEGNPGAGGWAAVLNYGGRTREISGGELATTNNRMELSAAIAALRALKEPCEVDLFTDSEYLRNGITKWIEGWKRRGWISSQKKPVKNDDLWRALDAATLAHTIRWHWLRGHSGHEVNELCDQLANAEMAKLKRHFSSEQIREAVEKFKASRASEKDQRALL